MRSTDFDEFADVWTGAWEAVGRNLTPRAVLASFEALAEYEFADIRRAVMIHAKGAGGKQPVTASDIVSILGAADGHPGAEEAWGIVSTIMGNEDDTAIITDPMREAWAACSSIFDLGDEIGARMAFREAYNRHVNLARQQGQPVRWQVVQGQDRYLRETRIRAAIQVGRLQERDAAQYGVALPAPGAGEALKRLEGRVMQAVEAQQESAEQLEKVRANLRAIRQMLEAPAPADAEKEAAARADVERRRKAAAAHLDAIAKRNPDEAARAAELFGREAGPDSGEQAGRRAA